MMSSLISIASAAAGPAQKISVHNAAVPVMLDRQHNIIAEICVELDRETAHLDSVAVQLGGSLPLASISSLQLVWSGTMSCLRMRTKSQAIGAQVSNIGGSQMLYCDSSHVEFQAPVKPESAAVMLPADVILHKGTNYFYISASADLSKGGSLTDIFTVDVERIMIDGKDAGFVNDRKVEHRLAVSVRQHGDDGNWAYRIPGLATTKSGTLIAVYDVRRQTHFDLQEDIDIGMSRSTDGGLTWEKMRIIMDMGKWGGLPQAQNGVGDPAVLVDETTGEIFVIALWVHGIGCNGAWWSAGNGMTPQQTGQLMIVSSKDDGLTWSEPRNITEQIKKPEWYLTLQGPGRGISMSDGTLVFAIQHIGADRIPNAAVIYSKDHGLTWHIGTHAAVNTTEAQVAEVEEGVLMLNMRNNAKTGRLVATSTDLGHSWKEHPSSGALREPVCMASLLKAGDVLLFSNPDSERHRNMMSIKASLDGGMTWLKENSLLLDEEMGWGYSCMSMIDSRTVGILYEGSTAQMCFQAVKLEDILKKEETVKWTSLPEANPADEAYSQGVSAMYAAAVGGKLIVAGGANFPGIPALDGGTKAFYDEIYLYDGKAWKLCGKLPLKSAYGVCVPCGKKMVCVGGVSEEGAHDKVWALSLKGSKAVLESLPDFPVSLEQAAGAAVGNRIYIAGGLADGVASDKVYCLDMKAVSKGWKECARLPEPTLQAAMAAQDGLLYIWGGLNPIANTVSNKGWCLDPSRNVRDTLPEIPDGGTMLGGCALSLSDGRILCLGGVDRQVFTDAITKPFDRQKYMSQPPAAYKFRCQMYLFDTKDKTWKDMGESRKTARAGAGLVGIGERVYLIGGEIKPGIRTSDVSYTNDFE